MELLGLYIDLARRHQANEEALRNSPKAVKDAALREWLLRHLERTAPSPGQACGTVLGTKVGNTSLNKRSGAMRFYGRTSAIEKQQWGSRVRCALNCRGVSPLKLRQAFAKVDQIQLRQMRNSDLRAAGLVLGAEVTDDGNVDVLCVVTDPVAMRKLSERAYPGLLLSMDGDDIADLSLIDSPVGFLEPFDKSSGADRPVAGNVICKLFAAAGAGMALWRT